MWLTREAVIAAGALMLAAVPLDCGAQQQPARAAPDAPEEIIAVIQVNLEERGAFELRHVRGEYWLRASDITQLGLKPVQLPERNFQGQAFVLLNALPGAKVEFDAGEVAIKLTVDSSILASETHTIRMAGRKLVYRSSPSAFVNYSLSRSGNDAGLGLVSLEAGASHNGFLFVTSASGDFSRPDSSRKFVHLGSTASYDEIGELRRYAAGDLSTRGWSLGGSTPLRGVAVMKAHDLNPYQATSPAFAVQGSAQFPSELDVYIDGRKVASRRLAPGSFNIGDITDAQGAHDVSYVLRDPFGREQRFSQDVYFTETLLREGLHDYAYFAGRLERSSGTGLQLGPRAWSFAHRWAPSDSLTLGGRAEGAGSLKLFGASATFTMGAWGLVDSAIGRSSSEGKHGTALRAAYAYQARRWGVSLTASHRDGGYLQLGQAPSSAVARNDLFASLVWVPSATNSYALAYAASRVGATAAAPPPGSTATNPATPTSTRSLSLSWNRALIPGRLQLQTSVRRFVRPHADTQVSAFLVMYIGRMNASASIKRTRDSSLESVDYDWRPPIGEGWGFHAGSSRTTSPGSSTISADASVQYNGPWITSRAAARMSKTPGSATTQETSLAVAGSIGVVDGHWFASRPVTDSFAIVKVGDVAGVTVTNNGDGVATTNARGIAAIPNLGSLHETTIGVDAGSVPIDHSLDKADEVLLPYRRSGVFLQFDARRYRAIDGRVVRLVNGVKAPVRYTTFRSQQAASAFSLETGGKGEFALEFPPFGSWDLEADGSGQPCRIHLDVQPDAEPVASLGELACQ